MANLPTTNNNPGDLRNIGQTGATQGQGGFASFGSPQEGYAALLNDIQTKINNHPNWTLADFSNVYAPSSDGNDTAQYTANLANKMGVNPDTQIGTLQGKIGNFAEAIASNEGYQGSTDANMTPSAAQTISQSSSSSPSWWQDLLGVGGIAAGIGAAAWPYAQKPLTDAAIDAGVGAIGGPETSLAGAGVGILQGILQDVMGGGGNQNNQPPANTSDSSNSSGSSDQSSQLAMELPQATKESQLLQDALTQGLQKTVAGRTALNDPRQAGGLAAAATYGLFGQNENGNYELNTDKVAKLQSQLGQAHSDVIAANDTGEGTSKMTLSNFIGSELASDPMITDTDRQAIAEAASRELNANYGGRDRLTGTQMREKQLELNNSLTDRNWITSHTSNEVAARKALSGAYGRAIENGIKDPDQKDLLRRIRKEEGHVIKAKKIGKILGNHAVPKEKPSLLKSALLKTAARYAEIYIGDKIGGPVGAVLGYWIGGQFNRALEKHMSKTAFDSKGMKAALNILKNAEPRMYYTIKKAAAEKGIDIHDDQPSSAHKEESKPLATLLKETKTDKPTEKVLDFSSIVGKEVSGAKPKSPTAKTQGKRTVSKATPIRRQTKGEPR